MFFYQDTQYVSSATHVVSAVTFITLHVTNENVIFQSIFECFPSNNSSTNPLEIKTLTKDIHLCSFLDITLFVSVMLHIKSVMLHIKSRGGAPGARPPPKIGKNMILWRKIVISHTKYPKNFRTSLRNGKQYNFLA